MKTETQIAEYFIKNIKKYGFRQSAEQHKEDSQRFLEFLRKIDNELKGVFKVGNSLIDDKITDLKQAIKLYNEAGISNGR